MKALPGDHQSEVGERIRRARKQAGHTQVSFSEQIGISTSELARIECGRQAASSDLVAEMADLLNLRKSWLLSGTGKSPDNRDDSGLSGAQIRQMRENLGMSREELSVHIGVKPSTLHNVELGHQRLGKGSTTALLNMDKWGPPSEAAARNLRQQEELVRRTVKEVCAIYIDPNALTAVRALVDALEDCEVKVITNLVLRKVFDANPRASRS